LLKRIVLPIVIIMAAIAVFIAMKQSKPESQIMAKPEKVWRVNTVEVSPQSHSPELTVYGRVETPVNATLSAALTADVIAIEAYEGDSVLAGQSLIKLDERDARLIAAQRRADLEEITAQIQSENATYDRDNALLQNETELLQLAQKAVSRAKKLEQSRLASQATLDDALAAEQKQIVTIKKLKHDLVEHPIRLAQLRAKQVRAQALLDQALLDVERCVIRSPFNGRIAKLDVAVGDRVRTGDSLLSLYDLSKLEVRAQIPNRMLEKINTVLSQGSAITAHATVADKVLLFKLARLSGEVANDSGGIDGLFTLVTDQQALALGTFLELTLTLAEQDNVIVIPYDALYELDSVYLIENGYLKNIKISRVGEITSADGHKQLLIRSEQLQPGDQIISTQLPNAMTGLKVEPLDD